MKTLVLTFSAIALLTLPALAASPRISAGEPIVVAQLPKVSVEVRGEPDRDRDRDHKTVIIKKHRARFGGVTQLPPRSEDQRSRSSKRRWSRHFSAATNKTIALLKAVAWLASAEIGGMASSFVPTD